MPVARYYYRDAAAPRPNRPTRVGVVALIERDGMLLLDHRVDGGWGLIGGGIEADESLAEALIREVREETGLTVIGCSLFGTFSDPSRLIEYTSGDVVRIITIAYWAQVQGFVDMRPSAESSELRFFGRDELTGLDIVATHAHIVAAYLSGTAPVLE
ncbi:MAG: NUDIX domain-containing protein [Anaerolineae bacterium]